MSRSRGRRRSRRGGSRSTWWDPGCCTAPTSPWTFSSDPGAATMWSSRAWKGAAFSTGRAASTRCRTRGRPFSRTPHSSLRRRMSCSGSSSLCRHTLLPHPLAMRLERAMLMLSYPRRTWTSPSSNTSRSSSFHPR
uniref:Uncharacterized protein n=1 Tax=Arundo donax TaxID=35708 RepID=A0A0A9GJB2_ARUDO